MPPKKAKAAASRKRAAPAKKTAATANQITTAIITNPTAITLTAPITPITPTTPSIRTARAKRKTAITETEKEITGIISSPGFTSTSATGALSPNNPLNAR